MKTIDILVDRDRMQDLHEVERVRQRKLYQDAVDIRILVEDLDLLDDGRLLDGSGKIERIRANADFFAGLELVAHIEERRRIVPNQDNRQAGLDPGFDLQRF